MTILKKLMPAEPTRMDRRSFLKVTGGATAGLIVGFGAGTGQALAEGGGTFNPFVSISPDGIVTVLSKHLDKGQGTLSGLAVLVAEELDADWSQMRGEHAPADASKYGNLIFTVQATGGSTGIPNSYRQYREAGAAARGMLVQAAAKAWSVPADEITVTKGVIAHPSGKTAGFGEFAASASAETPPAEPTLKSPETFTLIGKTGHHRLDGVAKANGKAVYTQDIERPGMLNAVLARPPKFGGKVASIDDAAARAVPGVQDVVTTPSGVAVLADNTWNAIQGRYALDVTWDFSAAEIRSTDQLLEEYRTLADQPGPVAFEEGDIEAALAGADKIVEAVYEFPYLCHSPMEPMNAVVELTPGQSLEIWTGSQIQTLDQMNAAPIAGIKPEEVKINTLFAGGSFGRRTNGASDYVVEAVEIAAAIEGRAPVKLVWTREDDIKGGYYRPLAVHKLRAGLDAEGNIVGWHQRIVAQSIVAGTAFEQVLTLPSGIDSQTVEGAIELPYSVGAHKLEAHTTEVGVPVLWWRSVGSTHTAYAVETMMDRLAQEAGVDPLGFRLRNMEKAPKEAAALRLAAEKAGWGTPAPEGVHRGLAVHKSFGSYVAQVADIRLDNDGAMKVEKVVCAIDCGLPVMPDQVKAQMEGSIGYGLGAVMRNKITLTEGEVDQFNFTDYEPTRMSDMPYVEVHIVPSAEAPTGVGEPGVPPIGPAVANALFAATGQALLQLPMQDSGVSFI